MPSPKDTNRDFTSITEVPGSHATRVQLARLHQRYHLAKQLAESCRVLEVACGAGIGLSYLAENAHSVVGGDYTESLLRIGQANCGGRIPLVCLDAQALPFRSSSFDLVLMFEAIYYLPHPEYFIQEAHRVLCEGGTLLVGTVNKDWHGFVPSKLSVRYFSVPELRDLLANPGFRDLQMFGAFPDPKGIKHKLMSIARETAAQLHLIPGTLGAREILKRLLYGRLIPIPPHVTDELPRADPPELISSDQPDHAHSILYCVARRAGGNT
ncbi:MAG: class I SAM-dependent methyltransferase [Armatimonadota bacterium]